MRSPIPNGVLVAAVLLLVGAAAAGVAWWNNLSHTHRALAFWGAEAAVLIRDAPHVAAFRVRFAKPADGRSAEDGRSDPSGGLVHPTTGVPARALADRDISTAKGLVHLRHALLDDRSFDWKNPANQPADLRYALAFERGGRRVVLFFSEDFTRLTTQAADAAEGRTVSTEPIAAGLRKYFDDVLPVRTDER